MISDYGATNEMRPTLTSETIEISSLPSGDSMTTQVIRVIGAPGKKVYAQANNHGGELAGNLAILELLRLLKDEEVHGELVLVPHVNPISLAQVAGGTRQGVYHDVTGLNFNRQFRLLAGGEDSWCVDLPSFAQDHMKSSPDEIVDDFRKALRDALNLFRDQASAYGLSWRDRFAFELQSRSFDADFFLDLHTGDVAPRYLYAFRGELSSARYLNSPHTLIMEDDKFGGSADEAHYVPWTMLKKEFERLGRSISLPVESYTVELGMIDTIDLQDARRDGENIANYLRYHGVLSGTASLSPIARHACSISDYRLYTAPASGLALFRKEPGEQVRSGEIVAEIYSMRAITSFDSLQGVTTPVVAKSDGVLVTCRRRPVVTAGSDLFKLMTNVHEVDSGESSV